MTGQRFPKSARLLRRGQFVRLAKQGERKSGRLINIESRIHGAGRPRLGVTATKKQGKAVVRCRFRRLVREAFRLCQHRLPRGLQVNVRPRPYSRTAKMADIQSELLELLL